MLTIRSFQQNDIVAAHALSSTLKWPHRMTDWQMMVGLGCGYVACDGPDIIGTALWWPFGADQGSIGMVIVAPPAQGRGIGRLMMDQVLTDAGSRTLHLNSTESGLKLYQRLGFEPLGAVRQLEGNSFPAISHQMPLELRSAKSDDFGALCAMETEATGFDRAELLAYLLQDGHGVIATDAGSIVGYGFRRNFGRGELIGPIVASSEEMAKSIIASLIATASAFVRIDCDDSQTGLTSWLKKQGLTDRGLVTRMARGITSQRFSIVRQFAVASQALG